MIPYLGKDMAGNDVYELDVIEIQSTKEIVIVDKSNIHVLKDGILINMEIEDVFSLN